MNLVELAQKRIKGKALQRDLRREALIEQVREETRHYRRRDLMRNLGYAVIGASIIGVSLYYGISILPESQSKKSSKIEQYVRE